MTNWTKHHVIHGENDNCPTLLSASSAPGESGISVLCLRFAGRLQYVATLQRHFVKFQMHPQARLDGTPASQGLGSDAAVGSFAIHPAGMKCTAALDETVDFLVITIDPSRFALAAVESREIGAHVRPHLSGYDEALFDLARMLAVEGDAGYPNGSLYWNDIAESFVDGLLARHTLRSAPAPRGMLGEAPLRKIRDHILAHIEEPIEIAVLAHIAGRSPFHFCRVFRRSVGMTPHRYVVHLRLQRAIELVRERRLGFAGIAATTGFADQSHLSRWVRRVYGVSLRKLAS